MVITEVRIKLMEDNNERLQAFCSVTFDDMFVIRDLKIIEGTKGSFVAMPSRKLTDRCPHCHSKNHLRARFCNQCGTRLDEDRATRGADGRAKLHADIAHPINCGCREIIQGAVLRAFQEERERSKQPGYVCRYDDYDGEDYDSYSHIVHEMHAARVQHDAMRGDAMRQDAMRQDAMRQDAMRAHGPHHAPRGAHAAPSQERVTAQDENREFGAGIF